MATLPMYAQALAAGEPAAWHQVNSPGGYEAWQFVARDEAKDIWIIASLSWGSCFLPSYLRKYEHYRRWPTRVRPPVGKDHCCASFAMYEAGGAVTRLDACVSGDQFGVSKAEPGVHVGANRMSVDREGNLHVALRGTPWEMTGAAGPALVRERTVTANLAFEPAAVNAGIQREMELTGEAGPVHRWMVSRPVCRVTGEMRVFEGAESRAVEVDGRGYHDRAWGLRPLAWDFDCGLRAFVLGENRAVVMRWQSGRRSGTPFARVVTLDGSGRSDVEEVGASVSAWKRAGGGGVRYPMSVCFGDAPSFENPRVLATTLASVTAVYEMKVADETSTALCELVDWRRLRSEAWGRLIELGVAKA